MAGEINVEESPVVLARIRGEESVERLAIVVESARR